MRGERPFVFTNIKEGTGVADVASFITRSGGLEWAAGVPPVRISQR
jgi:urease accessory protein